MNRGSGNVTSLLRAWRAGDATAGERLLEVLYRELHGMAHARLALERRGDTLQTTALVHECYLRLVDQRGVEWRDRGHFLALAATMMRRVLVDRARARKAGKRGAGETPITLTDGVAAESGSAAEVLDVDRALDYARTLMDLGHLPEARDHAERAYADARRAGNESVVTHALYLRNLIYLRLGDWTHAASTLAELEPRENGLPPGHYRHFILASQRALLAQGRGDIEAARAGHDRAVALAENQDGQGLLLLRRSVLELERGRLEKARSDAARAVALEQAAAAPGAFSNRIGLAHLALARVLRAEGKLAEARVASASAREQLEPSLGADHPDTRAARELELAADPGN